MTFQQSLTCFLTLFLKECSRFLRIWAQTLLPPMVTSSLYFLIFGSFIGKRIADIHGFSLMEFMTPGLIMMAVVSSAFMNVSSSFYVAKFQNSIEELLVSPMSNHIIILGFSLAGVVRAVLVGLLILMVATAFVEIKVNHVGLFLLFLTITAFLFSLVGLINGIFARKFDDISVVPTFILTPLSYLGGIFYSLDQIPEAWATVTQLNPIFYLINGIRFAVLGLSDVRIDVALGVLVSMVVLLYGLIFVILEKGIGTKS